MCDRIPFFPGIYYKVSAHYNSNFGTALIELISDYNLRERLVFCIYIDAVVGEC